MKLSLVIAVVLGIIHCQEVFGCGGGSRRRGGGGVGVPGGGNKMCFVQICAGNPSNQIRGCDRHGCGNYGARRAGGSRTHKGIDVVCSTNSPVYSPFPASVVGPSRPYANSNAAYNTGIHLAGTGKWRGYSVKMWYVKMNVGRGTSLSAGSLVGYMTNRASTAPGMINHVHVQLKKNGVTVNPTTYVC